MKRKGLFITIEGPEGAGKSTQAAMLTEWLAHMSIPVISTREPGDGPIGMQIRRLILDPKNTDLTPTAEALLYAADRAQHVETVLKPALDHGAVVICDRYVDSNIAYQGYGRGLDLELIKAANRIATGDLHPDLTILLTLPPATGLARVKQREQFARRADDDSQAPDRIEQEELAFHERLCEGYAELAAADPARIQTVDAELGMNVIKWEIRKIVSSVLLQRGFINETNINNDIFDIGDTYRR